MKHVPQAAVISKSSQAKFDKAVDAIRTLAGHHTETDIADSIGENDSEGNLETILGSFQIRRTATSETAEKVPAKNIQNAGPAGRIDSKIKTAGPPPVPDQIELPSFKVVG